MAERKPPIEMTHIDLYELFIEYHPDIKGSIYDWCPGPRPYSLRIWINKDKETVFDYDPARDVFEVDKFSELRNAWNELITAFVTALRIDKFVFWLARKLER